ncbi:hypothetical protein FUT69_02645 [Xylella taiwanensis]|uniref:Uncharacterized protein n=1 Tax=Xylella taiwanensis TaxID=1444770 RepID=Z9JIK3_9GAMM|nr:hypothetical protein [Xylella taiwanensis]AXI83980.1 hypothetical protein AB672_08555 [Xylella taiwanensis]EWS77843.1 hypothetical protein AF72_08680 [Xylella taiwanensis]MCD8457087.1 hypothetical protein [Xylella taiwanensis]MCD8459496.1 hypothetical protein [Xylella taiwanensis]MCD8461635.1 hypothetical protein [Xylella taiwanensis]
MKAHPILLFSLLSSGSVLAQSGTTVTAQHTNGASSLNLSLPQTPIQYRSDSSSNTNPPGTYYGDTSGIPAATTDKRNSVFIRQPTCEGQLSGAVTTGVGYSNHGGTSNWQAVNLNTCKTYYNDEGTPHKIGISITLGQSKGPHYNPGLHRLHPVW